MLHKQLRIPYAMPVRRRHSPRHARATVVFLHGIGNTGDAWNPIIARLPSDIQIITLDLVGFGAAPTHDWLTYTARSQARSLRFALLRLGIFRPIILVGHSLGSLIALEYATRHPRHIQQLILCSPPIYQPSESGRRRTPDDRLRALYTKIQQTDDQDVLRIAAFATKHRIVNESFSLTEQTIVPYMRSLQSAIVYQTAYQDALHLQVPTHIIRGALDAVVVPRNLRAIARQNPRVTVQTVQAGHEVRGRLRIACIAAIVHAL